MTKLTKEEAKAQWDILNRIKGHCVSATMVKGNRRCIVDITDKSKSPYFYTLIEGENAWNPVHRDRYKLDKKAGKIGSLPVESLRVK